MALTRFLITLAVGVTTLVACGSAPSGQGTGSLSLSVTAPAGVNPAVTVSGPNGFSRQLAASETISSLTPGSYTVTAARAHQSGELVDSSFAAEISGSPANVTANGTVTLAITYAPQAGSGGLWVADAAAAAKLETTQLRTPFLGPPSLVTAPTAIGAGSGGLSAVAFDASGNLWVAKSGANTVSMYKAPRLGTSSASPPDVTISTKGASLNGPRGLAIAKDGTVWVANGSGHTLVAFTASQLSVGGSLDPAVQITLPAGSGPYGLAFDAGGDLWVALNAAGRLARFGEEQLVSSGTPSPLVLIDTRDADGAEPPRAIAFNKDGELWVAGNAILLGYGPSLLVTSGNQLPTKGITYNSFAQNLYSPSAIAFDNQGNLWVANAGGVAPLAMFPAANVAAAGFKEGTGYKTFKVNALGNLVGLAFNPPPAGLPLPR